MAYEVEVTDTFGGEANYSWVNRYMLPDNLTDLQLVRRAKKLAGWSGRKCRVDNYGDVIELRPYGACMVMFISYVDVAYLD